MELHSELQSLLIILVAVAVGSYLQAFTGFALGIVVLAIAVLTHAAPIATVATTITIVALPGIVIALSRHWRHIDRASFLQTFVGVVPGTLLGLWSLGIMGEEHTALLQLLLGGLIVAGGIALFIKPRPHPSRSSRMSFVMMGVLGGLLGGLFSVPGPPMIYHYYRQPVSIQAIRTSLLALSGAMALVRLIMQGLQGELNAEVMSLGMLSIPVAMLASWLYVRFPPQLSDLSMRRGAFALFVAMGSFILLTAMLPSSLAAP
ncbi:TSUP family transporter [Pseudomonas fluorescens]|uniref:Probable membrane transporter protein n=1 Tax=Pseudomonas fluorescens TaxID=294 RepID=A0A5E7UEU4_PSEFL|nr:TSUP family transporter [Pseudomonas fluorescens]VVO44775.1 putative sulfite/organosulfonate exporter TauE [Pseudomonas fluorescens]VVQ09200.1 putative sulfite/organosulfonate exporter TauE [Pseudomonas fluorescens]